MCTATHRTLECVLLNHCNTVSTRNLLGLLVLVFNHIVGTSGNVVAHKHDVDTGELQFLWSKQYRNTVRTAVCAGYSTSGC